jgi:hypothetical protein
MVRPGFLPLFLSGLMVLASCGKKGPIEPPLVRVPQTVERLALVQRGATLLLSWTNPSAYIDGNPLSGLAEVEIWMVKEDRKAEGGAKSMSAQAFESKAKLLVQLSQDQFAALRSTGAQTGADLTYSYALAEEDFGRKVLTFSLRVKDLKERASAFAAPVSFEAVTPPAPPKNLRAEVFREHIRLSWDDIEQDDEVATSAKTTGYNVYRSEEGIAASRLNASLLKTTEFRDEDFSFGRTYRYFVRAVLESAPQVESDNSETAEITAKDIFPPAPPSGVTAIEGSGFIALSWEAGRESDLAGYRVWRRVAGETDYVLVAGLPGTGSSYSDSKVEKGRKYEYAITALDSAGNESMKSDPVSGVARDDPLYEDLSLRTPR